MDLAEPDIEREVVLDPFDEHISKNTLVDELYGSQSSLGTTQRRQLSLIASLEARFVWRDDDCRDMTQWVALSLGIGTFRARRITACARAIEELPLISQALETGVLSLDKTVELTRFATPDTEKKLISWARRVAPSTIKRRADEACMRDKEETKDTRNDRFLRWSLDEDKLWLEGLLPADRGLPLVKAIDKVAKSLTEAPGDERDGVEQNPLDQRRADALLQLALNGGAKVATEVVIHTHLSQDGFGNGVSDKGVVLAPEVVERLACDKRLRYVLTDEEGNALGIGEASPAIPGWVRKVVLKRFHHTCSFPGCDCRQGLEVHHSAHAGYRGPTDYDWLAPACPRHHDLAHLHDWGMAVRSEGRADWFRPNGSLYLPGPSPPPELE